MFKAARRPIGTYTFLGLLGCLALYPLLFMVITSLKTDTQFYLHIGWFVAPFHWNNYVNAFSRIWRYIVNSLIVSGASTLGVLIISSLSAYAFARLDFPGRTFLYYAIIAMMMIPFLLTFIPLFSIVKSLGLLNTYWGLVLPYIATGQALAVFILRTFFAGLANDLFEACRVEGGSEWYAFLRIALPLSKPVLGTVAILEILTTWNDYVWPLVVINENHLRTLALGMVVFSSKYSTAFGPEMAAYFIGTVPLLLLLAVTGKTFVRGLTAGALKF